MEIKNCKHNLNKQKDKEYSPPVSILHILTVREALMSVRNYYSQRIIMQNLENI